MGVNEKIINQKSRRKSFYYLSNPFGHTENKQEALTKEVSTKNSPNYFDTKDTFIKILDDDLFF